jgi:hypothetical protein
MWLDAKFTKRDGIHAADVSRHTRNHVCQVIMRARWMVDGVLTAASGAAFQCGNLIY